MADRFKEFDDQLEAEGQEIQSEFQRYAAASYNLETSLQLVHGPAIIETISLAPDHEHSRNSAIISYFLGRLTFTKKPPTDPINQNELYCSRQELTMVMNNLSSIIRKIEDENKCILLPTDETILVINGTNYFHKLTDPFGPIAPELKTYRTYDAKSRSWLEALER